MFFFIDIFLRLANGTRPYLSVTTGGFASDKGDKQRRPAVSPVTKATSNEESFVLRQGRLGCCCWMFVLPIVCVTLFINIDQGRIQT